MNLNRNVYEGWTPQHFINDLSPIISMIQAGNAITNPFCNKESLKKWLRDNQPYYKKDIPEVIEHFSNKYNLK